MPASSAYSNFTTSSFTVASPFARKLNQAQRSRAVAPERPNGVYFFDTGDITVATTSIDDVNDKFYVLQFPADCRLLQLQFTSADRDTNATPTLKEDINVETAAAVETTIINDSTIGQAGGFDELDANLGFIGLDVSNQKLVIKNVAVSATPAALAVRFKGTVMIGENNYGVVKF